MTTKLKNYFHLIRERQDVLSEIQKKSTLNATFRSWTSEQREEFLNLCTGVRGIKLLYDGFFKEIMNPEYVPERLNDFLSHMLRQEVRILKVVTMPPVAAQMMMKAVDFLLLVPYPSDLLYPYSGDTSTLQSTL